MRHHRFTFPSRPFKDQALSNALRTGDKKQLSSSTIEGNIIDYCEHLSDLSEAKSIGVYINSPGSGYGQLTLIYELPD